MPGYSASGRLGAVPDRRAEGFCQFGTGKGFDQIKRRVNERCLVAGVHPHKLMLKILGVILEFFLGGGGVGKIAPAQAGFERLVVAL